MKEKIVTNEEICPECKSVNILSKGFGHVTGSGESMRDADQFQYQCEDCEAVFWIQKSIHQ
ncbi:MAG: hypothetical protein ISS66_12595 [Desulfobacteraceae bacterium]|nr:hypothetical protein [Desulfobacteraceae bacterium]